MVEISITDDHLHLEVKGLDKLWAFKSQLDIPLAHIRSVRHDPKAASGWWHGMKIVGAQIPGVITAGQFYQHGQRVFWDVLDPAKSIIIELHDESLGELIVEVSDPPFAVEQIKAGEVIGSEYAHGLIFVDWPWREAKCAGGCV